MKRLVILVVLAFIFAGCATMPTAEDKSHTYNSSYDEVFDATKKAFNSLEIRIAAGSKESGFLNGKKQIASSMASAILISGKNAPLMQFFNINYIEEENSTSIQLYIYSGYEDGAHTSNADQSTYLMFWEELEKYL